MMKENKDAVSASVMGFLKNLPAFRYMKPPVDGVRELYERYPDGAERGVFAFAYAPNMFYSWSFEEKTWKPVNGLENGDTESYFHLYNLLDVDTAIKDAPVGALLFREREGVWGCIGLDEVTIGRIDEFAVAGEGNAITEASYDVDRGLLSFTKGLRFLLAGENAVSASRLEQSRSIGLTGGVTGTATPFDGSEDIFIPVTEVEAGHLTGRVDAGRLSGLYDIDISGVANEVLDCHSGTGRLKFWTGSQRAYEELAVKDDDTIYHIV